MLRVEIVVTPGIIDDVAETMGSSLTMAFLAQVLSNADGSVADERHPVVSGTIIERRNADLLLTGLPERYLDHYAGAFD